MKPPYLTATVVKLAKSIIKQKDWLIAPILADALQEAGYYDQDFLAWLRSSDPQQYPGIIPFEGRALHSREEVALRYRQRTHWYQHQETVNCLADLVHGHAFLAKQWENHLYLQAHKDFTKDKIDKLLQQAKEAYHLGKRSEGFWLKERARLIAANPGFVEAIVRKSLKGEVSPGMIWIV